MLGKRIGSPGRDRTADNLLVGQLLYRLSYGTGKEKGGGPTRDRTENRSIMSRLLFPVELPARYALVAGAGLEPAASRLSSERSSV